MRKVLTALALGGALALAACETAPVAPVAQVEPPKGQPLPYRWTNGNAEKARLALLSTFSRAGFAPGQFVWADTVPTEGDPRIVIDLLTQTAYAFTGDVLVGAASISSAKTGMVTPLGFWKIQE